MKHNRIATVTGISGCGKDHLLGRAHDLGLYSPEIPIIGFGDLLAQSAMSSEGLELVDGRDSLRNAGFEAIQDRVSILLDDIISRQPLIMNSHTVIAQRTHLLISPISELKLRPSHYVFISAAPDDIIRWRRDDTRRKRAEESRLDIELHQEIAMGAVQAMAKVMDAKLLLIHNSVESVHENARKIGEFIASL